MIAEEMKESFIQSGIDYDDLDEELIKILYLLNFKLGIKTKFSCYGHEERDQFYIMFDESCDFNKLEKFAEIVAERISGGDLTFKYWIRRTSKVLKNWMCETNGGKNIEQKEKILNEIIDIIGGINDEL